MVNAHRAAVYASVTLVGIVVVCMANVMSSAANPHPHGVRAGMRSAAPPTTPNHAHHTHHAPPRAAAMPPPALSIPRCVDSPSEPWDMRQSAFVQRFVESDGRGAAPQETTARMCWRRDALVLRYECEDDKRRSNYTQCNEPLYEADAVEFFVWRGGATPREYLEFEVSPHGVLFASRIINRSGNCSDFKGDLMPCATSGVEWAAGLGDGAENWWAGLAVPWALLGLPDGRPGVTLRGNLFRIDVHPPSVDATQFTAWSPTLARPACFHVPAAFATLELID